MAEADSDIFIGVGRNELTSGVNLTDDAYLVTAAGISKFTFLVKKAFRIIFASVGTEERKLSGEIVLRMSSLSLSGFLSISSKISKQKVEFSIDSVVLKQTL